MENLNAEQAIKELENQTKFAKFTNSTGVLLSAKCAQFCLDHAQYYEQRIKELSEENERLRGVGVPDNEVYIRLSDAKHAIMDYIGEQTVSKYASEAECKSARGGAEGAMNELDYLTPINVAPIADTVRQMQERLNKECLIDRGYEVLLEGTIDQIAKEMSEGEKKL